MKTTQYKAIKFDGIKPLRALINILKSKPSKIKKVILKQVVLYGAGSLGKMAKSFFDFHQIKVTAVVDIYANQKKREYKKDPLWSSTDILHPDDVDLDFKKKNTLIVCIVTASLSKIFEELKKDGWKKIEFFYDVAQSINNNHPLNNGWCTGEISPSEGAKIIGVLNCLCDEESKYNYLNFLSWRKNRYEFKNDTYSIQTNNRFFIPEIINIINNNELFLDCGAHHGSVIDSFLKITRKKYNKIIAIEPDKQNYKIISKKFSHVPKIKMRRLAISNTPGHKKFYDGFGYASRLGARGNTRVKTASIDSLMLKPTFIKIHLEGGELNCLRGALNTILINEPIIVITLYHNKDGLYKIPLFMMEKFKNYLYYIRTHSWAGTGVVLYCIPKKRLKNA